MRKQYFYWIYLVTAIVLTIYGVYSIVYNFSHNKDIPNLGIVFTIIGGIMLLLFLVLYIVSLFQKKKNELAKKALEEEYRQEEQEPEISEEKIEKTKEVEPEIKPEQTEKSTQEPVQRSYINKEVKYERVQTYRRGSGETVYVKQYGYGPVLRVTDNEILDMRSNTYYRIEGNMVNRSGSGPVFEIVGSSIRSAFGGYLYEISGSNVSKTYGGFYASFGGNILQTHDLNAKFEIDGSLNLRQKLAVVALLFGTY